MLVIKTLLALTAIYCGGTWLWLSTGALRDRLGLTFERQDAIERYTFHLGLCFILAVGFLGLIGD